MGAYRKKPVVIQAVRCGDVLANKDVPPWLMDAIHKGIVKRREDALSIHTKEGVMDAGVTDMVICGVAGEIYPCKADIFELTYDPA